MRFLKRRPGYVECRLFVNFYEVNMAAGGVKDVLVLSTGNVTHCMGYRLFKNYFKILVQWYTVHSSSQRLRLETSNVLVLIRSITQSLMAIFKQKHFLKVSAFGEKDISGSYYAVVIRCSIT